VQPFAKPISGKKMCFYDFQELLILFLTLIYEAFTSICRCPDNMPSPKTGQEERVLKGSKLKTGDRSGKESLLRPYRVYSQTPKIFEIKYVSFF
jgi:hypothetical protein